MTWILLNLPLGLVFVVATASIPVWLMLRNAVPAPVSVPDLAPAGATASVRVMAPAMADITARASAAGLDEAA